MTATDKDFIVAIELGSSHISAIAGKKKEGTMQVLAYAEEKNITCIRRGVIHNIEKTYQSINNLLAKLESTLKAKIKYVYVGISGQSLRSYRCIVKRNLITQSYITNEIIDSIRQESYEIPFTDCEVLENFPQEYVVDQDTSTDPVGVMGTNIDGEFLNVIARCKLRNHIKTVFANTNVEIIGDMIVPLELASNVLSESEKRSGCVLVDLGAETTTVLVYKGNIVRFLATIPLGMNFINKDLETIQIDRAEAEEVKLKYGNLEKVDSEEAEKEEAQFYTTSDGRKIEVSVIKNIIQARATEIIDNVSNQIIRSNYGDKLLAGIILTGGGANMKNIDKAFIESTKIEKCSIARTTTQKLIKTSNASGFVADNCQTNAIASLLLAGTQPCGGEEGYENPDIFSKAKDDEERNERIKKQKEEAEAEKNDAIAFDSVKTAIRSEFANVKRSLNEVERYGSDKQVRKSAQELTLTALNVLGENYQKAAAALEGKDKFKQSLKEGSDLAQALRDAVDELTAAVNKANKKNSFMGKLGTWLEDLASE